MRLLRDIVLEVVNPRRQAGFSDIHLDHVIRKLRDWSSEGKTTTAWGEDTLLHVAQHALASLRDFGIRRCYPKISSPCDAPY